MHDGGVDHDRPRAWHAVDAPLCDLGRCRERGIDVAETRHRPAPERIEPERRGCLLANAAAFEQIEHRRGCAVFVGGVDEHHGGEVEQHAIERGVEVVGGDRIDGRHVEQDRGGAAFEFAEHVYGDLVGVGGGNDALANVPSEVAVREWCRAAGVRGRARHARFRCRAEVGVQRLDREPVDGVCHQGALETFVELLRREFAAASGEHLVDSDTPLPDRGRGELFGQARACRRIGHRVHRVDSTEAPSGGPHPLGAGPVELCARGDLNPHALSDTST